MAMINLTATASWNQYPKSSLFRQHKRLGLTAAAAGDETTVAECLVADAALSAIATFLHFHQVDRDVLLASAYHVLIQILLQDDESLIGVVRTLEEHPGQLAIGASYVYAEADESIGDVLRQVADCQRHADRRETGDAGESAPETALQPAFFYRHGTAATTAADVTLQVDDVTGSLMLQLRRSERVAGFPSGERFLAAFAGLLQDIVADEERSVGELQARARGVLETGQEAEDGSAERHKTIAAIWAQLLNVPAEEIGADTSYFEIGGTSLNAFKLVNQVRVQLGVDLNIREIIDNDTLSAFCRLVHAKCDAAGTA